jgi:hypothetical protein
VETGVLTGVVDGAAGLLAGEAGEEMGVVDLPADTAIEEEPEPQAPTLRMATAVRAARPATGIGLRKWFIAPPLSA